MLTSHHANAEEVRAELHFIGSQAQSHQCADVNIIG